MPTTQLDFSLIFIHDKNSMDPATEAYKDKIGERVTRRLAQAVKEGKVTLAEVPEISSYILESIDKAKNNSELLDFLEDISKKWNIFSGLLSAEQVEQVEETKNEKVEQITSLIDNNQLDEALKVATDANKQVGGVI